MPTAVDFLKYLDKKVNSSGIVRSADSQKLIDVAEVLTASIIGDGSLKRQHTRSFSLVFVGRNNIRE
jgi:hypothetical protein